MGVCTEGLPWKTSRRGKPVANFIVTMDIWKAANGDEDAIAVFASEQSGE